MENMFLQDKVTFSNQSMLNLKSTKYIQLSKYHPPFFSMNSGICYFKWIPFLVVITQCDGFQFFITSSFEVMTWFFSFLTMICQVDFIRMPFFEIAYK